MRGNRGKLKNS